MKILIVDNDPVELANFSQMVAQLGWPAPGTAGTSDEAIEWINANGACDLLLSEVYLAPADGFTLRDTIQPHIPQMRTIFTSPHDISPYVDRLAGSPFLSKPTDLAALKECLTLLIGEPAPEP
ncbi:MAG: response regulator, partial [Verrucomicrobia bacterium]|nr:response regulator [Verrucomicrobiota bacterium]